ncbi:MAG: hypothetical protein AB8G14_02420 [Ilumatobacter sp.]
MAEPHEPTTAALDCARQLIHELHADDVAERWWNRVLELPAGVTIRFDTMGNSPERVRRIVFSGDFRVESLRRAADSEEYIDQADVWDLSFSSIDDGVPERGTRIDTYEQGGATSQFAVTPDVRRSPGTAAPIRKAAKDAKVTGASATHVPTTAPQQSTTGGVTIGELVPVEPFDDSEMFVDHIVAQLAVLRSNRHDLVKLLTKRPIDDATAMFGTAPGFLPVLGTMVDGAVIGHMVDAEELVQIDPQVIVYDLTMQGAVPAYNRLVLPTVLSRSLNGRWAHGDEPDELVALAGDLGIELRDGVGDLAFNYGLKRPRPRLTGSEFRWRNDSSGNGVFAPGSAWGAASVRKPTSTSKALSVAEDLAVTAPAAALFCAHEALVLANRANDVEVARSAYAAMVTPLQALERPRVAMRAAQLSTS